MQVFNQNIIITKDTVQTRVGVAHLNEPVHITNGSIVKDWGSISLLHTHALTLVMTENLLIPQRMLYQIPAPQTKERQVCPRRVGVKERAGGGGQAQRQRDQKEGQRGIKEKKVNRSPRTD